MENLVNNPQLHQLQEEGFGDWSEDLLYIMQRLRNPGTVGEGAAVVPKLVGFTRVPYVSGFRVLSSRNYVGGTEFTLGWIVPEDISQVDHFNIYAINLLDNNQTPTRVGASPNSPCTVRIVSSAVGVVVFLIQTVLKNGYANDLALAPSCTGITVGPTVNFNEILVRSVTKTSSYTVDSTADVYLTNTASANITVTLPAASSRTSPIWIVKTAAANKITVNPAGTDTINGETSLTISFLNSSAQLLPVTNSWRIL